MRLLSSRSCFLLPVPGLWVLLARVFKFDATTSSYINWQSGTETLRRSLFGLATAYNLLPRQIIDKTSVKLFQPALQKALCVAASRNVHNLEFFFSTRLRPVRDLEFQHYFET